MKMKEIGMVGVVIIFGLILAGSITGFGGKNSDVSDITGNVVANGKSQEVTLGFGGRGYVVNPPSVKAGQPVRMIADTSSLQGCMTAVRIPELGVSKNVRKGDNIIEFTPTTPGTYKITCSMGMGVGELVVA